MMGPDWLGWLATALTVASYFFRNAVVLRRIQATAAVTWLLYGVVIHSQPVMAANAIVMVAALGSSFRKPAAPRAT